MPFGPIKMVISEQDPADSAALRMLSASSANRLTLYISLSRQGILIIVDSLPGIISPNRVETRSKNSSKTISPTISVKISANISTLFTATESHRALFRKSFSGRSEPATPPPAPASRDLPPRPPPPTPSRPHPRNLSSNSTRTVPESCYPPAQRPENADD
jgi:hypothetical protein